MPTYQYRCQACDEPTEAVQKFTDPALTDCPRCGGPLRKVYNAVGIVFKGSGFYATDSRSKGKAEAAKPGTSATSSESSSSSSSTSSSSSSSTAPKAE